MFLLDTDVLSALGPERRLAQPYLVPWLRSHTDALYLSAVSIAEVEAGAARLRRTGASRKAELIGRWVDGVVALFGRRILPIDTAVARICGELHDRARAVGVEPGFADAAIAATAYRNGLVILTRNIRHFGAFGTRLHDPYESLPDG